MRTSLTLRLALLFAVVSSVVLLALGGTVGYLVEEHFEMLDSMELGGKMAMIQHALDKPGGAATETELQHRLDDALVGHESLMVAIYAADGRNIYATRGADFPPSVLAHHAGRDHHGGMKPVAWDNAGRRYRGIVASRGAAPALTVAIGLDTVHHAAFMEDFRRTLWAAIVLSVLLSSLFGWFAARRGLAPVRAMARVARGISAERLADRLPLERVPVELQELAASFNDMLSRLEDSFRRLSEFSSDLAHELRTPVSNLMTQTEVALSKTRTAEEYREVLYSNLEEYERLARMVSDMLFLAKADNGLIVPVRNRIDAAVAVDALIEFYRALAEEKGLIISRSGGGEISGDPLMLRRAVANILSNAIRHTPAGGRIDIRIDADATGVRLAVGNSGETIAAEYLPRLFDRFYRVDPSRSRSGEGSGLGLAIAKSIAVAHGGDIAVTSADGRTTFTLAFPGSLPSL